MIPKIVVLCNSRLALPSLQALFHNGLVKNVALPSKETDDTNDIQQVARAYNVEVKKIDSENFKASLTEWLELHKPDVVFVFTFPWRIPKHLLSVPKLGFLNFHFGLLPKYRGANAIFWPIKNREKLGGITVHKMDSKFDTGPVLMLEKVEISDDDTYGTYSAKLSQVNVSVLQKVVGLVFQNQLAYEPQEVLGAGYYSRPGMKDIVIRWSQSNAFEIKALVNACNPWNKGAYTMMNNMPLRIVEAEAINEEFDSEVEVGSILNIDELGISILSSESTILKVKVVALEEGIFSAQHFANLYNMKKGMKFYEVKTS